LIRTADPAAIADAGRRIRAGGLVAFPTETVYGLGADAGSDAAVARIFAVKGRPRFNPLIVHLPDLTAADPLVAVTAQAEALAARFWPGPLTLVLSRRADAPLSLLVSAGLETVAVRAPAHPVALALLAAAGRPIAAPSANRSGRLSPTRAGHVAAALASDAVLVLDGGACRIGVESTVIDLTTPTPVLLRPGGLANEAIEAVIGRLAVADADALPRSPGMLARHYAPHRPLRLAATDVRPGEVGLGFAGRLPAARLDLSRRGDLEEAAANLFAMLRALDDGAATGIAVAPIPEQGLGRAINDRLRRAATPAVTDSSADRGEDWGEGRGPAAPCVLPDIDDDAAATTALSPGPPPLTSRS
jgi:L-threonylcarbamoyladenylate synthase